MKTFVPSKKEKKTKNIETRDFSTPTEWNVEMVNDKVIVTLSGKKRKILEYFFWRTRCLFPSLSFSSASLRLKSLTTVQIYVLLKIRSENELGKVTADCRVFSHFFLNKCSRKDRLKRSIWHKEPENINRDPNYRFSLPSTNRWLAERLQGDLAVADSKLHQQTHLKEPLPCFFQINV